MRLAALALCLVLCACASLRCYPKVRIYHENRKPTGAFVGAYCPTERIPL